MASTELPAKVQQYLDQHQPELVSVTDTLGRIVFVNEAFAELAGYPPNELLGENHRLLKSGNQPQELFDQLWYDISHGKVWRGTLKNRRKDGSYFTVDTTITPVTGQSPRETHYIATRILIG